MSSDSENSIATAPVEDVKPKRRSSIFRPDTEPSQLHNVTTTFPLNYAQRLLSENIKWKETYTATKMDLIELKKKAKEDVTYPVHLLNLPFFEAYVRRAEEFCCQVNNMIELQKVAVSFQNIRNQELEMQVEMTTQKLRNELS
ncbi:hypothetical protein ILUMI_03370 [Ignelater luminosus]|uniref:Uncharacterized protein n=1 Tax=Ignelater luminosus TaxID=2038154 RepID=A0A8K0DB44_IGNLU|nr:hypothetical protein ILUMI_03370 [Ignelater luminosus]